MMRGRNFKLFEISTIITQRETVILIEPPRKDAAPKRAYLKFQQKLQFSQILEKDIQKLIFKTARCIPRTVPVQLHSYHDHLKFKLTLITVMTSLYSSTSKQENVCHYRTYMDI